jgi:hypothetical protein
VPLLPLFQLLLMLLLERVPVSLYLELLEMELHTQRVLLTEVIRLPQLTHHTLYTERKELMMLFTRQEMTASLHVRRHTLLNPKSVLQTFLDTSRRSNGSMLRMN